MELKYLDKLKCYRILSDSGGPPPGGMTDGWMGLGVGMGVWGVFHARMLIHTYTCTHASMHMHVKHAKHAKHGCLHVGGHLQFLYMYKCACVHVHLHVCGDTPMPPDAPYPPAPSPELQGAKNTKIQ